MVGAGDLVLITQLTVRVVATNPAKILRYPNMQPIDQICQYPGVEVQKVMFPDYVVVPERKI